MEAMLELEERLYGVNHWDVRQKLTSAGKKHVHNLAEAIIFQALEDLWVSSEIKKSLNFFTSADFGLYAEAAGMSVPRQLKVLRLIERAGFSIASRKERCHE
jgi:hypothetical protein